MLLGLSPLGTHFALSEPMFILCKMGIVQVLWVFHKMTARLLPSGIQVGIGLVSMHLASLGCYCRSCPLSFQGPPRAAWIASAVPWVSWRSE